MDNKLIPLTKEAQNSVIASQTQEQEFRRMQIYNLIKDVNMIVSFPFSDSELDKWSKTIIRLFPYADPKIVAVITDKFLKGEEDFEKDSGILNYTMRIPKYSGR